MALYESHTLFTHTTVLAGVLGLGVPRAESSLHFAHNNKINEMMVFRASFVHIIAAKLGQADSGDNEAKLMTKLAHEWVGTSDPVIRSLARYRWTTAPTPHINTIQAYFVTVVTHVIALDAGQLTYFKIHLA